MAKCTTHGYVNLSLLANKLMSVSHNKGLNIRGGDMDLQKSPCTATFLLFFFVCVIVSNFLCVNVYGHTQGKGGGRKASDVAKGASLRALAVMACA